MTNGERLRLFIAVAIPETVKAKLEAAQTELRRALPDANVRWARREQFHLTLKFLGDVEAARVESLGQAIHNACRGLAPLRLRLEGVGGFPNLRRARVLWTGVGSEAEQLARLQAAVDVASRDFTSEQKEQKFTGHVTLARIQGMKRTEAEALAELVAGMKERLFGQWTVCRIELMQSQLLPQGARHTLLAATALGESPHELA